MEAGVLVAVQMSVMHTDGRIKPRAIIVSFGDAEMVEACHGDARPSLNSVQQCSPTFFWGGCRTSTLHAIVAGRIDVD